MAAPQWSSGNGNMNDSTRSTAAAHNRQALPADSPGQPISNAGSAAYPNRRQHRMRRRTRSVRLPPQQEVAAVLTRTLQEHCDNGLAQSSNPDALANILAAQLHVSFPANHDGRSDVDSDVSWASSDESGTRCEYFTKLHRDIVRISNEPGDLVFSISLKPGARRLVHLLAQLNNCSHTTFGNGRVYVSGDPIAPSYDDPDNRCWNSLTSTSGYVVVPNAVTIRNLPTDATGHEVINTIRALGVSSAKLLRLGDDVSTKFADIEFDDGEDVARCFRLLRKQELRKGSGLRLRIQSYRRPVLRQPHTITDATNTFGNFSADDLMATLMEWSQDSTIAESMLSLDAGGYAHVDGNPPPVNSPADALSSFDAPAFNLDPALQTPRTPCPSIWRRSPTFHEQTAAGPSTYDTQRLGVPLMSRKRPSSEPSSEDATNNEEPSGTDGSGTSGSRGKRHPRIKDGYPCGKGNCPSLFDTQGECTKHRRIHLPKDQFPFPCGDCHRAFVDTRDLRRHQKRKHSNDAAAAQQPVEVTQRRRRPPSNSGQAGSLALSVQIPDSRLSTVATSSPYTQDMHTPSGGGSQDQSPSPFVDAEFFPDVYPLLVP